MSKPTHLQNVVNINKLYIYGVLGYTIIDYTVTHYYFDKDIKTFEDVFKSSRLIKMR